MKDTILPTDAARSGTLVGVGYRQELADWIEERPAALQCLEVTALHFYRAEALRRLPGLSRQYPLMVHGLGLSLGTPGPLDHEELERFVRVVEAADPLWISEHVAFRRTPELDLGHFNPIVPNGETVEILADHVRQLAERCRKPVILENIATQLRVRGTLAETEFLNRLCERAGCGLLLDVTNLFVNARNHGFGPLGWLRDIDADRVVQLHVVGYSRHRGHWQDSHRENIQEELWELIGEALAHTRPRAVILERDANFPAPAVLESELTRLQDAVGPAATNVPGRAAVVSE